MPARGARRARVAAVEVLEDRCCSARGIPGRRRRRRRRTSRRLAPRRGRCTGWRPYFSALSSRLTSTCWMRSGVAGCRRASSATSTAIRPSGAATHRLDACERASARDVHRLRLDRDSRGRAAVASRISSVIWLSRAAWVAIISRSSPALVRGREVLAREERLRGAVDGRHRRPQLVRDRRDEVALLLVEAALARQVAERIDDAVRLPARRRTRATDPGLRPRPGASSSAPTPCLGDRDPLGERVPVAEGSAAGRSQGVARRRTPGDQRRGAVPEADDAVGVDEEDPVADGLEHARRLLALGGDRGAAASAASSRRALARGGARSGRRRPSGATRPRRSRARPGVDRARRSSTGRRRRPRSSCLTGTIIAASSAAALPRAASGPSPRGRRRSSVAAGSWTRPRPTSFATSGSPRHDHAALHAAARAVQRAAGSRDVERLPSIQAVLARGSARRARRRTRRRRRRAAPRPASNSWKRSYTRSGRASRRAVAPSPAGGQPAAPVARAARGAHGDRNQSPRETHAGAGGHRRPMASRPAAKSLRASARCADGLCVMETSTAQEAAVSANATRPFA